MTTIRRKRWILAFVALVVVAGGVLVFHSWRLGNAGRSELSEKMVFRTSDRRVGADGRAQQWFGITNASRAPMAYVLQLSLLTPEGLTSHYAVAPLAILPAGAGTQLALTVHTNGRPWWGTLRYVREMSAVEEKGRMTASRFGLLSSTNVFPEWRSIESGRFTEWHPVLRVPVPSYSRLRTAVAAERRRIRRTHQAFLRFLCFFAARGLLNPL